MKQLIKYIHYDFVVIKILNCVLCFYINNNHDNII